MNRHDIITKIGAKYHVENTETGEFSCVQALKSVGKDIKDYQKATIGTKHQFLDIRFTNDRLVILVECKSKDSKPVIDATHEFSDDGYMPDWEWMESYIKSLPYSDRI